MTSAWTRRPARDDQRQRHRYVPRRGCRQPGTIARSGTSEFLKQLSGDEAKDARLIGQFGVGFYSAFIVADEVTVETRRAGAEASDAVRWQSQGEGEFSIESIEREQRGTTVTLKLKPDETEFADEFPARQT